MRAHILLGTSIVMVGAAFAAFVGCGNKHDAEGQSTASAKLGASESVRDLMKARGLNEADVEAALKTYVPSGKMDEYYIFASGGQSGNINVIGVPSMRQLRVIGVFTPESWQGWGYGSGGGEIPWGGKQGKHKKRWGDVRPTK